MGDHFARDCGDEQALFAAVVSASGVLLVRESPFAGLLACVLAHADDLVTEHKLVLRSCAPAAACYYC